MQALRVSRGIALLFLGPWHTRWGWGVSPTPLPLLSPGKTRYPLYRRLGGPHSQSGWAVNLIPTSIRSRTIQPLVSCYTDWATRSTSLCVKIKILDHLWISCSHYMTPDQSLVTVTVMTAMILKCKIWKRLRRTSKNYAYRRCEIFKNTFHLS